VKIFLFNHVITSDRLLFLPSHIPSWWKECVDGCVLLYTSAHKYSRCRIPHSLHTFDENQYEIGNAIVCKNKVGDISQCECQLRQLHAAINKPTTSSYLPHTAHEKVMRTMWERLKEGKERIFMHTFFRSFNFSSSFYFISPCFEFVIYVKGAFWIKYKNLILFTNIRNLWFHHNSLFTCVYLCVCVLVCTNKSFSVRVQKSEMKFPLNFHT
jgi:hypothetical protein